MFSTLCKPWRAAFEMAWEAFVNGSLPIGAAIADESEVISVGRNRLYEPGSLNPKVAHAETEAIFKLDTKKYPGVYTYALYATTEPCPMCMGAFVMANLRKLRIAARDNYCGAAHYCADDKYIASKNIKVEFEGGIMETAQDVMMLYYELRATNGETNKIIEMIKQKTTRRL